MDLIKINSSDSVLIIRAEDVKSTIAEELRKITENVIVVKVDELKKIQQSSHDVIILGIIEANINSDLFKTLLTLNKPGGRLMIDKINDINNIEFMLKTSGYTNIEIKDNSIICCKPKYEVGSTAKLNLTKPKAVWKLDDDGEDETIDPDNLLDDEDLKKPDPSSLRVCGTTGKRKACKDCSCGLAEELSVEAQNGNVVDTSNAPKSSCGNCYLGDAFRCASCPYLGMPAFKPGEKVQLSENLLKSDI